MRKNKIKAEPLFRVTYIMRAFDPTHEEMLEMERQEILNAPTACHAIAKVKETLEIVAKRTEQDFGSAIYEFTNFSAVAICPHCRGTGLT